MSEVVREGDRSAVFLSYSRDDLDFADQLDAALRSHRYDVAIDRQGISPGEDWQARLGGLIREADTVVFVLSPSSARSETCRWEVEQATRLAKRIIPVICRPLGDASPPPQLAALNYIFFYGEPRAPGSGFGTGLARLVSASNTDLTWLREHTRLLQRASEWDAADRGVSWLLFGDSIAEAKAWAARRPKDAPEPTALHYEFIRASEEEEARRQDSERQQLELRAAAQAETARALAQTAESQKREAEAQKRETAQAQLVVRRTRIGAAVALALAMMAAGAAYLAYQKQQEAIAESDRARAAEQQASAQRDRAREAQSRAMALFASQETGAISAVNAAPLALEALPDQRAGATRPYTPEAEAALYRALFTRRDYAALRDTPRGEKRSSEFGRFSPDGKKILTLSRLHSRDLPIVWDRATARVLTIIDDEPSGDDVFFVLAGTRVLTRAGTAGEARLWDAETGERIAALKCPSAGEALTSLDASVDGRRAVLVCGQHLVRLIELSDFSERDVVRSAPELRTVRFSEDAEQLVLTQGDRTMRVIGLARGEERATFRDETDWDVVGLLSPDGAYLVDLPDEARSEAHFAVRHLKTETTIARPPSRTNFALA